MPVADIIGVMGGWLVGLTRSASTRRLPANTLEFLEAEDVTLGLMKAAVFGFIISVMGAYQGMLRGRRPGRRPRHDQRRRRPRS